MSGYAIFVHQGELHIAHGLDAAQQLATRLTTAIANGEATGVVVKGLDGALPIVEAYNDASFWRDVADSLGQSDYNALTRDTLAAMFGIIAGILTLPAGPTTAVMVDMTTSEIYKKTYDAITLGTRDYVDKLFDFLDKGRSLADLTQGVSNQCNRDFNAARNFTFRRDPLVSRVRQLIV